jgi:two-component system KDP operon response regulator KdpE
VEECRRCRLDSTHVEQVKLAIIEDEKPIRSFIRASLGDSGFKLREAETGKEGIAMVAQWNPDVVLLDLGLPDMDGLEVTQSLREWSQVPIIVLSARGREQDKIDALDAGADDYLTKPFSFGELMARIRVALRHRRGSEVEPAPVFEASGIRFDQSLRRIWKGEEEVHLTPIEYKLFSILVKHSGKVVTHKQLLHEVWGPAYVEESHYLRVYFANLRHKLEDDPARPKLITTEAGVGYRLHEAD